MAAALSNYMPTYLKEALHINLVNVKCYLLLSTEFTFLKVFTISRMVY